MCCHWLFGPNALTNIICVVASKEHRGSELRELKLTLMTNNFQANLAKEDLSDMVAEHAAKQSNKRKRQAGKEESKSGKKYKEFKF